MVDIQADKLIERMQQDMRQALKDRAHTKLDELRSLLARISNAEAVPVPSDMDMTQDVGSTEAQRKELSLADVHAIIIAEAHEIETTLQGIDEASDYAVQLREKLTVVRSYLSRKGV